MQNQVRIVLIPLYTKKIKNKAKLTKMLVSLGIIHECKL